MATKKIQPIDDSTMGQYAISNYEQRIYNRIYYAIRDLYGLAARRTVENFNWSEFKEQFSQTFGLSEEKRYSLAQLIDFAERKFGKCLEDLLDINERSWKRRELWQEQHQRQEEYVEDAVSSMMSEQ